MLTITSLHHYISPVTFQWHLVAFTADGRCWMHGLGHDLMPRELHARAIKRGTIDPAYWAQVEGKIVENAHF